MMALVLGDDHIMWAKSLIAALQVLKNWDFKMEEWSRWISVSSLIAVLLEMALWLHDSQTAFSLDS